MCAICQSLASISPYVNGLLCGTQWAVSSLTYSFPTNASNYGSNYGYNEPANNFEAFSAIQQVVVAKALNMYSSVSNLTFVNTTESDSQHAVLRFAQSSVPPTAWGYYPTEMEIGGDVWFGNSRGYYTSPAKGNYAFYTTMHEIGHALGLKHPHQAAAFGTMPIDKDQLEYTVMSYCSYQGADPTKPLTVEYSGYPQSLMMYDIAAIQHMYGAKYNITSDTVYSWSPTTGEEFINGVGQGAPCADSILMTVWAGHTSGTITYDFSNYTSNLIINLQPGAWTTTSVTQLSNLGNGHFADGNIANALLYNGDTRSLVEVAKGGSGNNTIIGNSLGDKLYGGAGNDKIYGGDGNDIIFAGPGNDYIDGGNGTDTVVYSGKAALFHWVNNGDGTWSVTKPNGTDTLRGIEILQFTDQTITIQAPEVVVPSTPTGSVDPAAFIASVTNDIRTILRTTPTTDQATHDASLLASGLTRDAYIAQLIAKAHDSSVPAIIVYAALLGATPTSVHLDDLAPFVFSQVYSPGYQATYDPQLGGYEAMGLGLSKLPQFTTTFGQGSDTSFITMAYQQAFGKAAGSAQVDHFQAQLNYFEGLYQSAGIAFTDAVVWARGAVFGQIIGVGSEAGNTLAHAAENFLVALAHGNTTYGVSLLGTAAGHGNFADAHLI